MSRTLAEWLDYQERVHVRSIELGLVRLRSVWQALGQPAPAPQVITVAGTNGKGSTVALLEAMLLAAGRRVGAFTSPHLLAYNERVRVQGEDAADAALIGAFERIEAARGDIPLTYFEFGTLAALLIFANASLDVAVLEVGLGGRLDAVNIIDADVAVITTVGMDHMDWLGNDLDSIGREKAGIARSGRPAVVGQLQPPEGLLAALAGHNAQVQQIGQDFIAERTGDRWLWRHRGRPSVTLPLPALAAPVQLQNAATALAALHALDPRLLHADQLPALGAALAAVRVPARLQCLGGDPVLYVDVGHNPQAAGALAEWLDQQSFGAVHAVFGALADKDVAGVLAELGARIAHWHLVGLDPVSPRGMPDAILAGVLVQTLGAVPHELHADIPAAIVAARQQAAAGDCVLAFGSFFVASAALASQRQTAAGRTL